ncbi:DUF397 domain-containing protein [Actinomadura hibisca]|uniref:DUF397 domain-containing protein n=1 Tax=Actinomadura hibisca TaxID=68565 RepID=UPI0008294E9D|nr:DUF397 domain-containing protein [Actinomadura hibisca]
MIIWRKSSHSGGGGAGGQECIEVARLRESVGFRDSKAPDAGHLSFSAEGFAALVSRVKRDELSL